MSEGAGAVVAANTGGKSGGGKQRDQWSSRLAFYMAGIGAAVGFGKSGLLSLLAHCLDVP